MYDNPKTITYSISALAFGGAGSTRTLRSPRGINRGNVRDVMVAVTVTFTQVTTPAFVRLGWSTTPAYYAELNMGAAAAGVGWNFRDAGSISRSIDLVNDPVTGPLAGVLVTFVAATGGTPAGTGDVHICIEWA